MKQGPEQTPICWRLPLLHLQQRGETEKRAGASVAAKTDTFIKDVALAKTEARTEMAGDVAQSKDEVIQEKERLLQAESRPEARALLKVALFRRKAEEGKRRTAEAESSAERKMAATVTSREARMMQAKENARDGADR